LTISSTEIVVTWDPVREIERNGIIGRYEVQFNQSALSEILQVNFMETEATNLTLLLQNLQEFVEYSIAVRAYSSVGAGPFSPAVNNQTFEDEPNAPPSNVQAITISSTAIMVTWDPVQEIERNGIITQYEVEFNQSTFNKISTSNLTTTNGSQLMVELEGLEEYVEYSVRVRAYTSVGPGPFSVAVVNRTLEDVPNAPPENVQALTSSSTAILVIWDLLRELQYTSTT